MLTNVTKEVILAPRINDVLNDAILDLKQDTLFDTVDIKNYILRFLQTTSAKAYGYIDVESVYLRIAAINNLLELVKRPILLMITMHVLVYIEKYYQTQKYLDISVVQRDLFHFFTILLINDASDKIFIENNYLSHIGRMTIEDCIINFARAFAEDLSTEPEMKVVNESELQNIDMMQQNTTQTKRLMHLKRLLNPQNDPTLFNKEDSVRQIKFGRDGCVFIKREGEPINSTKFIHNDFLDYFSTLLPSIKEKRRKTIKDFIKDSAVDNTLSIHFGKIAADMNLPRQLQT